MLSRIYGRVRLTGRPALHHAVRQTQFVGCHIAGPMVPIVNFFSYFFLGQGHESLNFSDRYLKIILGKISPQGVGPPNFFLKSECIPFMVTCLQNFIPISPKLWPVDVWEHSKHAIIARLRLRPEPMGVWRKNFFSYFFLGQVHDC